MNNIFPVETERLIIRKTSIEDVDLILKQDKQEQTQKFLGGVKNKTREERLDWIKRHTNSLTACLKDNTPIGLCGIHVNENNYGIVSYIFDEDYTGKGYCTECVNKLVEIGFDILNLDYLYADTYKDNLGSIRVLNKVGFKETGMHDDFIEFKLLKK
jgi:ribosomal-protein-alanine N-acetyltransferase